jgi:Na+-driven multidrug efflux pump
MDIWFVAGFHMGVAGVAWATFICQGISAFLALFVVMKKLRAIRTEERCRIFSSSICIKIAKIAIPSILQQSFVSVGNIILQGVINGFGPGVMAGYSAAIKLNNLVITSFTTLGNGISNYTGQNLGAGKLSRIPQGFRAGIKMVWLLSLPIVILYITCGRFLLMLFMNTPSQDAMHTGLMLLRIVSPFYFVISAKLVSDGVLRGAGLMGPFMVGTFTDLILRVLLAVFLSGTQLGATGIWCAWPVGWTISAILSIFFYSRGPWRQQSKAQEGMPH